jgi:hypothetical protein
MYDEHIEEGFGSGLCSLVSCWNSYGIPCGMVGYDKDGIVFNSVISRSLFLNVISGVITHYYCNDRKLLSLGPNQ